MTRALDNQHGGVTKELVKKYAIPFHKRSEAGTRRKGRRPVIVPKTFGAIWKLFLAPPKEIFVPDPMPKVNWLTLKTHFKKNLPKPEYHPVHGVSKDPEFYLPIKTVYDTITTPDFGRLGAPFGTLPGLETDQGIVGMPQGILHGYTWNGSSWVIAAGAP